MMNQDNPYAMNQTCKVCGEPAAGFHFGAFTCEGCKSFFGRSYNNLSSIADCKNNGECIINKKNRTACKACRLRKCILVGMSKSGSRYGRRSNWFKIHCLLQEQQQQQQAALAAHHSQQQQQQQHQHQVGQHSAGPLGLGQKPPPPPAAAAAALGMLGHHAGAAAAAAAAAYPGLFPPRTKEELMMLGLEEYAVAKHSAAVASSPSVSSPESHNSDSSVEVNVRNNPLLHLSGKHATTAALETAAAAAAVAAAPQLRKDLPPFLPLHFPAGLASMPVMPPPAFLPPSHLLFPGYHPALYPHHQGLLKPLPDQQQAAAAAAMQQLFASSSAANAAVVGSVATTTTNMAANRYASAHSEALGMQQHSPSILQQLKDEQQKIAAESNSAAAAAASPTVTLQNTHSSNSNSSIINNNNNNNNHLPNGSKVADEFSKRFYLDAMLKSQRGNSNSPPVAALLTSTKLPAPKHDHSISALFTPNSEVGGATRERLKSRQSNDDCDDCVNDEDDDSKAASRPPNGEGGAESDCGEDLVVSMTPPRSPAAAVSESESNIHAQDDPIDLSMKPTTSRSDGACSAETAIITSCDDSVCSNNSTTKTLAISCVSPKPNESNEQRTAMIDSGDDCEIELEVDDDDDTSTVETVKSAIQNNNNNNCSNSNSSSSTGSCSSSNDNNNSCKKRRQSTEAAAESCSEGENLEASKRKLSKIVELVESEVERAESKCVKLLLDAENMNNNVEQKLLRKVSPLDLTTKV